MIFNFSDIIIPARTAQIYMFDWAYAIYPECPVWQRMRLKDYLMRRLKVLLIKKYINNTQIVIGQTRTVCERLKRHYNIDNIKCVPSAVNLENMEHYENFDFKLSQGKFKLLYISTYSPHKNLEILISLAQKIKQQSLPYEVVITIDSANNKKACNFIKHIKDKQLDSIIVNVGHVKSQNVASLYKQSDALLMPTLLESYGLPYVEAMYHGKTILTSDIDFAHDVCGEAAFYFDPLSAESLLMSIKQAYSSPELRKNKNNIGKERVEQLLTWEQVFDQYQEIIESTLELKE